MKLNVEKLIEETKGTINPRYALSMENAMFLLNNAEDNFDLLVKAFYVGYAQARKEYKHLKKEKE